MANRFRNDYRRDAGAIEDPAKQQVRPHSVGQMLGEDRLAPMFKKFYGGLEGNNAKPATGNGHAADGAKRSHLPIHCNSRTPDIVGQRFSLAPMKVIE